MFFKQKQIIVVLLAIVFLLGYLVFVYQLAQQGSVAKNTGREIEKRMQVFASTAPVYFMPRFPERLTYLATELAIASQELEQLGKELDQEVSECGCQNFTSECFDCQPRTLIGSPCPNQRKVEGKQFEVETKLAQIFFLRRLLGTELTLSLERELKTLRQDVANDLRNNVNTLLQESQDALEQGENVWGLSRSPDLGQCQAQCGRQQEVFRFAACLNPGQQKTIDAKFSFGISLTDLPLGQVTIRNVNLGLPERIQMPQLPELESFTIPLPAQTINFPDTPLGQVIDFSRQAVVFHPPGKSAPRVSNLKFSCPQASTNLFSSYQWAQEPAEPPTSILEQEFEEYFQKFDELREMCLRVLVHSYESEEDPNSLLAPEYEACHVPEEVRETIINMCATLQQEYNDCIAGQEPEMCEPPPPDCDTDPPPFEGKVPETEVATGGGARTAPGQTIANFPASILGCQTSPPTLPKITFPKITIPDIKLPHWKLKPFFDIRLPSFIFEDLVLPDLKLCDLNNCANFLPELKFSSPVLDIPTISAPTIALPQSCFFVQGAGQVCVDMPDVEMTSFQHPVIPFTSFQKFNLGNLLTPELELPGISLPKPQVNFSFRGIKLDFKGLILGLLSGLLPDLPSGCLAANLKFIPIKIQFDDFVFSWPVFPEIPQVSYCREVNQFCQDIKGNLGGVIDQVQEIERVVNGVLQNQIQARLDTAGQNISQKMTQVIQEQLQNRAEKISQEIQRHTQQNARVVGDKLQIPGLTVPLDPIIVPQISLQQEANLPATLQIPWPERLKKIALRRIIRYPLPSIPLSNLSYQKDFSLKIPGFQAPSLTTSFSPIRGACQAGTPSGANPFPVSQIQSVVSRIGQVKNSIEQTSQNIVNILR